jgi:hypothetical protein
VAVGVDGTIGPEWAGINPVVVTHKDGADEGNFGTPSQFTDSVGYDIYVRGDATYLYVGLETTSNFDHPDLNFTNLYFGTPTLGSTIGFEVTNNDAFVPGVAGSVGYTPGTGPGQIDYAVTPGSATTPSVIEVAIPWIDFTTNALGLEALGFSPLTSEVQLRLSQSFGYSVAGGATYGDDRLGLLSVPGTVPEPASIAAWGVLGVIAGGAAWRRHSKTR